MNEPPPEPQIEHIPPVEAGILLTGEISGHRPFELALKKIPNIEVTSTHRSGTQYDISLTIPGNVDSIQFLKRVLGELPGIGIQIQGTIVGQRPKVVCKVTPVSKQSSRGPFGFLRPRTRQNTPKNNQPRTTRTEIAGFSRPDPVKSVESTPPALENAEIPTQELAMRRRSPFRDTMTAAFFLFGDVELALAKFLQKSKKEPERPKRDVRRILKTGITNTFVGLAFILGDFDLWVQKLRGTRKVFSRDRIRDITLLFAIGSQLIHMATAAIFGTDSSDLESSEESPKS